MNATAFRPFNERQQGGGERDAEREGKSAIPNGEGGELLLPPRKEAALTPRATTARIGEFDACAVLAGIAAEYLAGRENVQTGVDVPPRASRGAEAPGMLIRPFEIADEQARSLWGGGAGQATGVEVFEKSLLPRWMTASGAPVHSGYSTTDERVAVRSA